MKFTKENMQLIYSLQDAGILGRELQPIANNSGGIAYWHYEVLKPELLPESLKTEYAELGEIRI